MIEIHTGIQCSCGQKFYALITIDTALPKEINGTVDCPKCHRVRKYKYEYEGNFKCVPSSLLGRFFNWFKSRQHYISSHFTKTEAVGKEVFPRKCCCGKEILLVQRRVL